MQKKVLLKITVLLPITIILISILKHFPHFIETFYSHKIYPYIALSLRYAFGWLPFSFGDLVYGFGIIYILRWLIYSRKIIRSHFKIWLLNISTAITIIYIAFNCFWGINYYRLKLNTTLDLKPNYTTQSLIKVTKQLILKSNTLQIEIVADSSKKITFSESKKDLLKQVPLGYKVLKKTFPKLQYKKPSIKLSTFSTLLTYMGFSGYLNPLTNEAHINKLIPKYKFPTTAAHEIAHQLGYAAENEANFIGFLASCNHPDKRFKYTGYTFGLRYCLSELKKRDLNTYKKLTKTINSGILKNFQDVHLFWKQYQNPTEPLFKKSYNQFLKANNQQKGMLSYNYVVALIVNYVSTQAI